MSICHWVVICFYSRLFNCAPWDDLSKLHKRFRVVQVACHKFKARWSSVHKVNTQPSLICVISKKSNYNQDILSSSWDMSTKRHLILKRMASLSCSVEKDSPIFLPETINMSTVWLWSIVANRKLGSRSWKLIVKKDSRSWKSRQFQGVFTWAGLRWWNSQKSNYWRSCRK